MKYDTVDDKACGGCNLYTNIFVFRTRVVNIESSDLGPVSNERSGILHFIFSKNF